MKCCFLPVFSFWSTEGFSHQNFPPLDFLPPRFPGHQISLYLTEKKKLAITALNNHLCIGGGKHGPLRFHHLIQLSWQCCSSFHLGVQNIKTQITWYNYNLPMSSQYFSTCRTTRISLEGPFLRAGPRAWPWYLFERGAQILVSFQIS